MLLLNVINNFKNIVENKQTNAATWCEKDTTSQNLEGHHRTKEALKKYYENIKKSVRKEVAEEKKRNKQNRRRTFCTKKRHHKGISLKFDEQKNCFITILMAPVQLKVSRSPWNPFHFLIWI